MGTWFASLLDPSHIASSIGDGIFAFFTLLALVLLLLDNAGRVRRKKQFDTAWPASARIVKVSRSIGNGTYGGTLHNITLEVMPAGGAPYQVKATWCFEPLALQNVKAGDTLAVRLDPKHRDRVYSAERWAWDIMQLPLRFGNHVPFFYWKSY